MKRLVYIAAALTAPIVIVGCATNPYFQFYKGRYDAKESPGYEPLQGEIHIYSSENLNRDAEGLLRRGYQVIGESTFNTGGSTTEYELREQAERVGAHVALVSSRYTDTVSGAVPLSLPQVQTSYSNASATAYGRGGMVNAYGTGTTTTYGSQTVMVPYSTARYDVAALYFAKFFIRFGAYYDPLDDATRKRLQTNSGVQVKIVVEGTPAFKADILPGDIILKLEGESVESPEHFSGLIEKFEGQSVTLQLDRDGKSLKKTVQIRKHPESEKSGKRK